MACRSVPSPLIAVNRQAYHPYPLERFTEPPSEKDTTEREKMNHLLLATMAGRHSMRNANARWELVIGITKAVLGFRQFSLHGLENVKGELNLVAMAWNLKRMFIFAG